MSTTTEEKKDPPTFNEVIEKAAKSAMRGGTAGAVAMGLNVGALMWMRTTVRLCIYRVCMRDIAMLCISYTQRYFLLIYVSHFIFSLPTYYRSTINTEMEYHSQ